MSFGIYIHWPYCARICPYCDFNVYKARGDDAALVGAIRTDLAQWRQKTGPKPVSSIHFGGGTPSLMNPADIAAVIDDIARLWPMADDLEIGLEANPADNGRLADLRIAGIERLSLGVQALDDADLKALGRDHTAAEAEAAIAEALRLFPRTSVDMITARAGLDEARWRAELNRVLAYPLDHLSVYQLTIEPGTAFDRAVKRGTLKPPGDDLSAALYEATIDVLNSAGFAHYEISNFARRPEAQSRHNLIYWHSGEWLGVGPGGHGRLGPDAARTAHITHMKPAAYIEAVAATGTGVAEVEHLTPDQAITEMLLMGLRLATGVPRQRLIDLGWSVAPETVHDLESNGLLVPSPTHIQPTARGRQVLDALVLRLL